MKGQWDLCVKKHRTVKILYLYNNSAKILKIWNNEVLMNLIDLKEAELDDLLAIEIVRLGTVKW